MVVCGDVWWFWFFSGGLRWFAVICGNKAVRQRSDLLFIETSFWFEENPCAVRTNTAGLGRLCTLFVLSTLLVF